MWKRAFPKFGLVLTLSGLAWSPARAENKAEQLLRASHDCVAAHSVEIQQLVEQTAVLLINGKPTRVPQTTKQTSTIEIDAGKGLVRMTTKDQNGKDLVLIRKSNRIAMKIGSGPWTVPTGPSARLGAQLADPFACALPKPGEKQSPRWRIVGPAQLAGQETTIIETVGATANPYARERMREGITSMFPNPATRPAVEVLAYKSRHWIGKEDHRRLRVEQTSHQKMTMPATGKAVIDGFTKTTSIYSHYDQIAIEVPEDARLVLEPR